MLEPTLGAQADPSMCRERNRAQKGKGTVFVTQQAGGRASPASKLSLSRLLSACAPQAGALLTRSTPWVVSVTPTFPFPKPAPASRPSHLSLPPSPSLPRAYFLRAHRSPLTKSAHGRGPSSSCSVNQPPSPGALALHISDPSLILCFIVIVSFCLFSVFPGLNMKGRVAGLCFVNCHIPNA